METEPEIPTPKNWKKWVIQDWTSKVLWDGKQFNSFEKGWGWIYEQDPMPDESHPDYNSYYDDYYVVPHIGLLHLLSKVY